MSQCHDNYQQLRGRTTHLPLRASDLMTRDPVVVDPTATVRDIADVMLRQDVRMVPVVDIGEQLVGVVSEADLICRTGHPSVRHHSLAAFLGGAPLGSARPAATRLEGLTAEEIMSTAVVTCDAEEPLSGVVRRMMERDVRTMPVLDHGRLAGVLSRHDILRSLVRPDSEIRGWVTQILNSPVWAPARAVEAEVLDGVVVLTGKVGEPVEASVLCSIVREVPGVIEVVDRIVADAHLDRPTLEAAAQA